MNPTSQDAGRLLREQLGEWDLARANYEALRGVKSKEFRVGDGTVRVQFNPARIRSSAAKVDAKSIQERKCFLCGANLPAEQRGLPFGDTYRVLVNPYPIFPEHLTIPDNAHTPQVIAGRYGDMLDLAKSLDGFTIFYNGPGCGASAPDHAHFQAGIKGFMPIENELNCSTKETIYKAEGINVSALRNSGRNGFVIEATDREKAVDFFERLYSIMPSAEGAIEPMMNVLAWYDGGTWSSVVFPRASHRPACFYAEGEANILISPASVDLGGVFILPLEKDFDKITAEDISTILKEVTIDNEKMNRLIAEIKKWKTEPTVSVGVLWNSEISFVLCGGYLWQGESISGEMNVSLCDGKIQWNGSLYDELRFEPKNEEGSFIVKDVVIGINFHWERKEDQQFEGALKLIVENGVITAVNIISVEKYLVSVISSEMSATASLSLLKAHAVISRTWLLAQIERGREISNCGNHHSLPVETETERIRWYDREDHTNFDVCADDHCQRYQGITRANTNIEIVRQAVEGTRGQILEYEGRICDARFYKCCGGVTEEFGSCWEDSSHPYLVALRDDDSGESVPDLTDEATAREWILSRPAAFCNTNDQKVLGQVCNDYDNETTDFFRWQVSYSVAELSELVRRRSGVDFGEVRELIPVQRGVSARLVKLKIVGSKRTMTIGKELEIRRTLSESHLYSSAFVVDKQGDRFTLRGAGWGHGVGLCQIGAAIMGEKGYSYEQILLHYYKNATIEKIY